MKCKNRFNVMVGRHAQPVDSVLVCVHTANMLRVVPPPLSAQKSIRKKRATIALILRGVRVGSGVQREIAQLRRLHALPSSGARSAETSACMRLRGSAQSNGPTSAPLLSQSGSRTSHPTDRVLAHI